MNSKVMTLKVRRMGLDGFTHCIAVSCFLISISSLSSFSMTISLSFTLKNEG